MQQNQETIAKLILRQLVDKKVTPKNHKSGVSSFFDYYVQQFESV